MIRWVSEGRGKSGQGGVRRKEEKRGKGAERKERKEREGSREGVAVLSS